jgi:hypothetical protein
MSFSCPQGGGNRSSIHTEPMRRAIADAFELNGNPMLEYFNNMLMNVDNSEDGPFAPDINGYTFGFIMPPDLSGYEGYGDPDELMALSKLSIFLILDFTPPAIQVISSEIPARSGAIQFSSEVQSYGQMQITFIDNSRLRAFGLHDSWVHYIEDVTRGVVSPNSKYFTPDESETGKFGQLDYATSAYIVRFRPTVAMDWGDIVYIGKAIGIFPINLPDKEVIGRRDSNELTMLPISYSCALYRQVSFGAPAANNWLWDEFTTHCLNMYNSK